MTGFPFLAVGFVLNLVAILFVISCIVLVLIVLVQKGKGGGLSSAFGGGMASGILGSKTGDFLTWVTIVSVGVMLLLAVVLAKYYKPGPTVIPGSSTTTTTQTQPAGTTSQPAPSSPTPVPPPSTTVDHNNSDSNSLTVTPVIPSTEVPEPNINSAGITLDDTNSNSDTNQPEN